MLVSALRFHSEGMAPLCRTTIHSAPREVWRKGANRRETTDKSQSRGRNGGYAAATRGISGVATLRKSQTDSVQKFLPGGYPAAELGRLLDEVSGVIRDLEFAASKVIWGPDRGPRQQLGWKKSRNSGLHTP